MSEIVSVRWLPLVLMGVVGCAEPKAPAPEADAEQADQATQPQEGSSNAKKRESKRDRERNSKECEAEKALSEAEQIEQWSLELRKKQPIYFLGVPMRQIPTDNWQINELMWEVKPDYVIETGTLHGGSALFYAAMLEFINPEGKVLTVDVNEEQIHAEAKNHPLWAKRIEFVLGSSIAKEVHQQLAAKIGEGKRVFVMLDTLHAPEHVATELDLYAQYVHVGGYMVLQDSYYEGLPEVLDEFLNSHPGWIRDTKADDRFIFSKYRGGFLKREK
jgi:cephalosporin hydroxylase